MRSIRPAPTTRTTASATSATTSARRTPWRARRRAADAAFFERGVQAAGAQVQQRREAEDDPVASETMNVNAAPTDRRRSPSCAAGCPDTRPRVREARPRQQQPQRAAPEREHAALGHELPQQPPAAGANRSAHGELAVSRLRASEEKVREVRARDQEHEADGGLQHPDRAARRADDILLHRLHLQRVTVRREHVILRARSLAPARHERASSACACAGVMPSFTRPIR